MYRSVKMAEAEAVLTLEEVSEEGGDKYFVSEWDIDLDEEERKQQRSNLIRTVVLAVLGAVVLAVVIAVIAVTVGSDDGSGMTNSSDISYRLMIDVPPIINNSLYFCGPIYGAIEEDVYVFKGIPYAASPEGDLRFEAPQSLESEKDCWLGSQGYQAHSFGPKCYQQDPDNEGKFVGNEDCLFINVWSPQLGADGKKCVMVYIHGGGLISGSGHEEDTLLTSELTQNTDCVFVSFNYRLNVFGFLAAKTGSQTSVPGNFGFLDQIEALKWVQKNIAAFGGDPNKVTVFGDGAGGTSVMVLLSSPLAQGLFQRAWLISAAPKVDGTLDQADHQNLNLMKQLGCHIGSHDARMRCLRGVEPVELARVSPWDEWKKPHLKQLPTKSESSYVLAVVDGNVIPKPSLIQSWQNKPANDVPLLIGSTAQEVDDDPGFPFFNTTAWPEYKEYVEEKFREFDSGMAQRVLSLYPNRTSPEYQLSSMISDMRAVCPTNEMARAAAEYFKSPVHRYVVTHQPQVPVEPHRKNYAFHKLDLYAFLGNVSMYSDIPLRSETSLSTLFQRFISDFAQEGIMTADWLPYPDSTATMSSGLMDFLSTTYKTDACKYWQEKGMFPAYAWTN